MSEFLTAAELRDWRTIPTRQASAPPLNGAGLCV